MKVYLYKGGLSVVEKSGVGSAIHHQEKMLRMAGVSVTQSWAESDVVHRLSVPIWQRRFSENGSVCVTAEEMLF